MSRTTLSTLTFSLVCLAVVVAGFAFMLYKVHSKELILQTQLNTLSEVTRREDSFYKLQRLAEESKGDRELLSTHFVKQESDSITVLNWIEGLAPQAGVYLETKGLQKITEAETNTDWIEASFTFSGERAEVERFIAILERLPYLSYITSVSQTARSSNNWEAKVTLRVYLFTYAQ